MGLAALAARGPAKPLAQTAAMLFLAGILLFSGSLYGLALTGIGTVAAKAHFAEKRANLPIEPDPRVISPRLTSRPESPERETACCQQERQSQVHEQPLKPISFKLMLM